MSAPAGWYPDPTSRFELRHWSGTDWSDHVVRGGVQSVDPLHPVVAVATESQHEESSAFTFEWDLSTVVLTHEGETDVSSWAEFAEALEIFAHRPDGLIGIAWTSGKRQVRCYLVGGRYAVDVKKWRDGTIYDVWEPSEFTLKFDERQVDEDADVLDGWSPETLCVALTPAQAFAVARQWMETETVASGYTLRPMSSTEPYVELNLGTWEEAVARREAEREAEQQAERARALGISQRGPRPDPLPFGVSDAGAEVLVRDWMRHLGAVDAETTRASQDGGIDVVSAGYLAQVKNYRGSVGAPEVRELYGVAQHDGRAPLFFTSGAFTAEAIRFSDAVSMALITYDANAGTLTAANATGADVLRAGLWRTTR